VIDVAEAIGSHCKKHLVGIRPGEKLHEVMITESDSHNTYDIGDYYVITENKVGISKFENAHKVEPNFVYSSDRNPDFLSVQKIRELIETHIDHQFTPA